MSANSEKTILIVVTKEILEEELQAFTDEKYQFNEAVEQYCN